jgi:hypothetical protein
MTLTTETAGPVWVRPLLPQNRSSLGLATWQGLGARDWVTQLHSVFTVCAR